MGGDARRCDRRGWGAHLVAVQPCRRAPGLSGARQRTAEMTRIDIAVKYPGRIIDLPIHEGDSVRAGMILARQDTAEVQTQILGAEAQRQRALSAIARAEAELDVR
ncbi:biotin/lipoyl-binding protein [Methylocystis rosea]|uniref:Biotin/lipoyl-binding protein n=1 Tax=Methylocystis rosea TaxID=173366 RepID=A0A3G8MA67_9HYPH|nr:biotin/lipoyl-binding protein [Methylocystis rosea]